MKSILLILISLFLISCNYNKDKDNQYLYNINSEGLSSIRQPEKIKAIEKRELKKYKATNNRLYLISSKFITLYNYADDKKNDYDLRQIPLIYELQKLNNNEYEYITIACNFALAFQFENSSPDLSFQFLNEAIEQDEKSNKKYFLPHLYHIKGRLFYNDKKYPLAIHFFNKALKTYDKKFIMGRCSMLNNLALCYHNMNKIDLAIQETNTAIKILENNGNREKEFLSTLKGNLGSYYLKLKNYDKAENLLLYEFSNFEDREDNYPRLVVVSQWLSELYTATKQNDKMKELINFLTILEPKVKKISDKLLVNNLIQNYYFNSTDIKNIKIFSKKSIPLNKKFDDYNKERIKNMSAIINQYMIQDANHTYEHQITNQKIKIWFSISSLIAVITIFSLIIVNARKKNDRKKIISETNKRILEDNIKKQQKKIDDLHLNLNLKIKAERAFLEHLKKIKNKKNVDIEETLKNLFIEINNLIQINNKNYDLINESSLENKIFIKNISNRFPSLTDQELKLCVYFKLNLSAKEISILENISEGTARVYKTKIKTKMNIGKETDFNSFLQNI